MFFRSCLFLLCQRGVFSIHPVPPLPRRAPHPNQAFPSAEGKDVTALRCSEPLRSKVGGASKPSPYFAGWDRLGITGASKPSPYFAGWDRLGITGHQSPRQILRAGTAWGQPAADFKVKNLWESVKSVGLRRVNLCVIQRIIIILP